MHRCSCSTRALETFVKEFAGIDLRQQRAQRFFQQSRALSTRHHIRHTETTAYNHADDGFIPFQLGNSGHQGLTDPANPIKESQETYLDRTAGHDRRTEEADGEWHAEVEILEPGMREEAETVGGAGTVDAVCLLDTKCEVAFGENSSRVTPVLHLPAISQHLSLVSTRGPSESQPAPGSKAISRMLRKVRRKEAGIYKPNADSGLPALDKIEAMGGPTIVEEAKKATVQETVVRSAAKKKGVDRKAKTNANGGEKVAAQTIQPKAGSLKLKTPYSASDKAKTVKKETWQIQKAALDRKFGEQGWQPRKRLSPDTLEGIRALHASDPATYSTATLAEHFQIAPEAIRRVLRSKWRPKPEEIEDRMKRWEHRGARKWEEMAATGVKPPKRWREMGVQNPLLKKKMKTRVTEHSDEAEWKRTEELADRLPFEGSFAERLL